MKRPKLLTPLAALLSALCLLGFSSASAQILSNYETATSALRSSVTAFPTDQVASLDALRKAEAAFVTLGEGLEPTLRRGLQQTFDRAEEAVVNQSETDLQVQAAVLQGGFSRAVYQQALEDAANGKVAEARNFLGVLARDLGFGNTQFGGAAQGELQSVFEARLAKRGLAQLSGFGGDLGSRYRTLAQIYGYIFLVQDSPRLPPETRDTVVGTIRALVTEQPTAQGINLLKAQLTGFARRAERVGTPAPDTAAPVAQTIDQGASIKNSATPGEVATPKNAPTQAAPNASAAADTTAAATNSATNTTATPSDAATEPFVPVVEADASETLLGGTPSDPTTALPGNSAQNGTLSSPAQPGTVAALPFLTPFLTPEVRALLLMAAGLLALVGLIRVLFAPSLSPWQDAAVALLLLPAVAEGLVALAVFLAPRLEQPLLERAGAYSLFTNPFTQLMWVLLTAVAILCLAVGWRTAPTRLERRSDRDAGRAEYELSAAERTPAPQPTRSSPLNTGTLNWDEDF